MQPFSVHADDTLSLTVRQSEKERCEVWNSLFAGSSVAVELLLVST